MSSSPAQEEKRPSDKSSWAAPVLKLHIGDTPQGATNINLEGRQLTGALQGFGQMWQKTYRVQLKGVTLSAADVMSVWKAEFPNFLPPESRFYPTMTGIQPGQVIFIDLKLPVFTKRLNIIPVSAGVMVLYADETQFTVMTPQGFVVSGWNTFSVLQEEGGLVAQIQSLDRATDPIYELGTMFMGGARRQEENWLHTLGELAKRFGVAETATMQKVLVDPRWQWKEAKNVWQNASIRTFFHDLSAPLRWLSGKSRNSS